MARKIDVKDKEYVEFIKQYRRRYGMGPTAVEIQESLSPRSLATIHRHINELIDRGVLFRIPGKYRSLRLG